MAKSDDGRRVARRLVLKALATASLLTDAACGDGEQGNSSFSRRGPASSQHDPASAKLVESPITRENRNPGTSEYLLKRPAMAQEIEGYASQVSRVQGDSLEIFVNVPHAQPVRCDVYRIGYYQGLGARLLKNLVAQGRPQAPPPLNAATVATGLIECAWRATFEFTIEQDFLNGYYLCKLTNAAGLESYVPFIVRESGRIAPLLVQASVTTWQAYNTWGGVSLYVNDMPSAARFRSSRGFQVSFDRPYTWDADIGLVEQGLVRFLEERGYDVGYVTNIDIDRSPALLNDRKLFVTTGHDEYWTVGERNTVQAARDAGLSLAFLSGNTAYRRIRLDQSSRGADRRVITNYKSATLDPHRNARDTTADFGESPYPRPENGLLGVLWAGWAHLQGFPLLVSDPSHWVYEGTGVVVNDSVGHIVGYEWDVVSTNSVSPHPIEIIADSTALHEYGVLSRATATVFYPTASSFVFAAGTISWCDGLGTPGLANPRAQRVTENILRRAGLQPELFAEPAKLPPVELGSASGARVLAGSSQAGNVDGKASDARFNCPSGIAAGPQGELYVCDSANHAIRRISSSGDVDTLVGPGRGQPALNSPNGIVVNAQGVVYFSDSQRNRIYALQPNGNLTVFAGGSGGNRDNPDPLQARFTNPRGLALDSAGALYVADFRNDAIRRIDDSGVTTVVSTAGGPTALTVAPDGTLYYVATWNANIVKVDPDGKQTVLVNPNELQGDRGGPGASTLLRPADGLCLTDFGLAFCDSGNNRIRTLTFDRNYTVSTLLGTGRGGANVGTGLDTELVIPRGLIALGGGYVVVDSGNNRILSVMG